MTCITSLIANNFLHHYFFALFLAWTLFSWEGSFFSFLNDSWWPRLSLFLGYIESSFCNLDAVSMQFWEIVKKCAHIHKSVLKWASIKYPFQICFVWFLFVCQHRSRTHIRSRVRNKSCYYRGPNIISLVSERKFHRLYSQLKTALFHFFF